MSKRVLYKKECKECNEKFETFNSKQTYCFDHRHLDRATPWMLKKVATCIVCGKKFETYHPNANKCSEKCRAVFGKKYPRRKKLGHPKTFTIYCLNCGTAFETKKWGHKYCSDKCRPNPKYPHSKKEIIEDLRMKFIDLKKINPEKAQMLADEMEKTEGPIFRDMALDGLAPFKNSYIKKELD